MPQDFFITLGKLPLLRGALSTLGILVNIALMILYGLHLTPARVLSGRIPKSGICLRTIPHAYDLNECIVTMLKQTSAQCLAHVYSEEGCPELEIRR